MSLFGFFVGRCARKLPVIDDKLPWAIHRDRWPAAVGSPARRHSSGIARRAANRHRNGRTCTRRSRSSRPRPREAGRGRSIHSSGEAQARSSPVASAVRREFRDSLAMTAARASTLVYVAHRPCNGHAARRTFLGQVEGHSVQAAYYPAPLASERKRSTSATKSSGRSFMTKCPALSMTTMRLSFTRGTSDAAAR